MSPAKGRRLVPIRIATLRKTALWKCLSGSAPCYLLGLSLWPSCELDLLSGAQIDGDRGSLALFSSTFAVLPPPVPEILKRVGGMLCLDSPSPLPLPCPFPTFLSIQS